MRKDPKSSLKEKPLQKPVAKKEKVVSKADLEFEKKVSSVVQEKFFLPLQEKLESFQQSFSEQISKMQKRVESLDNQLNPKVDFTIDFDFPKETLQRNPMVIKCSESFVQRNHRAPLQERSAQQNQLNNYSVTKLKNSPIRESAELRTSMFCREDERENLLQEFSILSIEKNKQ